LLRHPNSNFPSKAKGQIPFPFIKIEFKPLLP
jgi:hypothetical protein